MDQQQGHLLHLLALEDVAGGEAGHWTIHGVRRFTGSGGPTGGIIVTAVSGVPAGQHGLLKEEPAGG